MSGLPGSPVTNASGVYTGTVSYNWSGTVTPTLAGYDFTPATRSYTNVQANQAAQNYTAAVQTLYDLRDGDRGSNPLANVVMSGLPGSPVTNASGVYTGTVSYNWTGTVTPTLAGYTFSSCYSVIHECTGEPDGAELHGGGTELYDLRDGDRRSNPLANVVMSGLPGNPVTNASGVYTGTVSYNWSGTVTPTLAGYNFTPATRSYTNVQANQAAQNYTAAVQTLYDLRDGDRGSNPLANVVMSGLPGSPVTNASGVYTGTVSYNWTGTVTPTLAGYTFSPATRSYTNVLANQTAQNYTAAVQSFTISGTVTPALANVVMSGLPGSPVTNASGVYTGTVSYNWSGTVTPTLAGYDFTPATRSYTNVQANQAAQNYTAAIQTFTISGTVTSGGNPLAGVVMSGLPGNPVTNASGVYTGTVSYNWSGTVTPTLAGYDFTPATRSYTNVQANQTAQNYTAALQTFTISGTVTPGESSGECGDERIAWESSDECERSIHGDGVV